MSEPLLERELKDRAEDDPDANDFWARYQSMKNYLNKEYYPWIQAQLPFYTDHGELHIRSVIRAASDLVAPCIRKKPGRVSDPARLTELDIFLILSGILWHDVGNVYGRAGHAKRVAEMTEKIKFLGFPNPTLHRFVNEISTAHAGKNGLSAPKREEDSSTEHNTYTVYPSALAAIVRFADEISEDRSRISFQLLDKIPDANKLYWEYANCIAASRPDPARKRVILTIELQREKAKMRFPCDEFPSRCVDGSLSLIEYLVCRIEKMNNERAYCARKFSRYIEIDHILCRFAVLDNGHRSPDHELEVSFGSEDHYPEIGIYNDFFERYPGYRPESF